MSAAAISVHDIPKPWTLPYRGKVAMASLIIAESAIFTIFVVAYLFYLGKSLTGPTPKEVLETPIFFTICLLSSSITVHFASKSLERNNRPRISFSVVAHDYSRWPLSVWHRSGMAPAHLRTWADDLYQSLRNNLLLTGWSARVSRQRRTDHAHCRAHLWFGSEGARRSVPPR